MPGANSQSHYRRLGHCRGSVRCAHVPCAAGFASCARRTLRSLQKKRIPHMPAENVERKLSAILSADVKGYSRLMGEDEVGTLRMLTAYREVTDALIQQHRGRIVGTAGDGLLAEFASAVDAVQGAIE